MLKYITKRLLLIIPVLIGISLLSFLIIHLSPGDPLSLKYGLNPEISPQAKEYMNKLYGLDKPIIVQYVEWFKRILTLDFGTSFIDDRNVLEKIKERLPATLILNILSLILIFVIAIPVGVVSAVKHRTVFDKITTFFLYLGFSMPSFWFALILIYIFGFKLNLFPISGISPWYLEFLSPMEKFLTFLKHLFLPLITLSLLGLTGLAKYTKSSMLEILNQEYILMAKAKGLSAKRVIYIHALKNALLPIITIIGFAIPGLISGSFIIETVFSWPGMGRLAYEAIMSYDYPTIMGIGIISTFLTLIGILISDILYAIVDPRIRV